MATRRNLCPNPACGNNTTGWSSNSTFARSTTITGMPVSTGINFNGNGFMQVPTGACAPGDVLTLSFYIKNNTGISIPARTCYVGYTRSAGGDTFPETFTVTPGNSGTVVRGSFTAAAAIANATGVYVLIDAINGTFASGIDISAVLIEKAGALDTYFDGDTPGASWDGTAGNSTSTSGAVIAVRATSTASVAAGRVSTASVTAPRTSAAAISARATSSGGVT